MYVINRKDLPSNLFEGGKHGPAMVSIILSDAGPGEGPMLHRHAYDETWVIQQGRVQFWAGEESGEAVEGDIVVTPPNMPHKFKGLGPGLAKLVCIHASPNVKTEWLE